MKLEVSESDLRIYLFKYFGSLNQYQEKYFPLLSGTINAEAKHLAYICPLCVKNFIYIENDTIHYSESFSLDHFPPKNIGGTKKVLVCKKCNNTAGHSYENSLKERIEKEAYNRKIPNIEVQVKSNLDNVKGWLHGAVSIDETGNTVYRLSANQKGRIPPLNDAQKESNNDGKGWKMHIDVRSPDEKKVTKALLKTAYLYCFDYWGYEFVFSFAGELFRKVLNDKAEYPIITPTLWYDDKTEVHKGINIPTGMVFIEAPRELRSIYVNIPMALKDKGYNCIVPIQIPNPTDNDFKEMIRVQQHFSENPSQIILIKPIPYEIDLRIPKPYSKTWEELNKQFP